MVPANGGTRCRVEHADIGHGAADDQRVDAALEKRRLEVGAKEAVVAVLAEHQIAALRGEFIDNGPAVRAHGAVFAPYVELGIVGVVRILRVEDRYAPGAGKVEDALNRRQGGGRVGNRQGAGLTHEVVLHIDDEDGRSFGVDPHLVRDGVLGDVDLLRHQ